jgi:hypothetical protein
MTEATLDNLKASTLTIKKYFPQQITRKLRKTYLGIAIEN